jgi:predicted phosphodiesterase
MKYAILSDIHSNLEALEAVLKDLHPQKPDKICVLGDTIGYGPNPRECLKKVHEIADVVLFGNHEKEAIFPQPYEMSSDAREALDWNISQLQGFDVWEKIKKQALEVGYKEMACKKNDSLLFVHASPEKPTVQYIWPGHDSHYIIFNDQIDRRLLDFLKQPEENHTFCGHTHAPSVLTFYKNKEIFDVPNSWNKRDTFIGPHTIFFVPQGNTLIKKPRYENRHLVDMKMIINPGSVGQPRDGNRRASYAIYDGHSIQFRRVSYNLKKTQKKLAKISISPSLKKSLIQRLENGS